MNHAVTAEVRAPRSHAVAVIVAFAVALLLIPAALVFRPLGAFGTPAAVLGVCAAAVWLLGRLHPAMGAAFGPQPMRVVVLGFLGAVLVAYIAANLRVLPGVESRGADRALLSLIAVSGVALLVMDGLQSQRQLDRVLQIVVALASVGAAIGLAQFFVQFDLVRIVGAIPGLSANRDLALVKSRVAITRVAGTAMHPIEFGVVCAMVLPLAVHFARRTPARVGPWIPVALLGLAIPTSVSRSGILALIIAMIVYAAVWSWNARLMGLVVAAIALAPARFVAPGLLGTLGNLFLRAGSDASVQARTEDYATTSATIMGHLWFGRGFGTYLPPSAPILDNQFLGQFVETGLVGLIALLVLGCVAFGTARGARRRNPDPVAKDQAQALAAAVVAGFVTFATYDFFGFALGTGLFFLLLGCIGASWRLSGGVQAALAEPELVSAGTGS